MRCFNCFKEYDSEFGICPHCGSPICDTALEPIHLSPGTILQGRYLLGQAVGAGGFGIIYRALDLKLETIIAIKEFFSPRLMTRAAGESSIIISKKNEQEFNYRKDRFLAEARNMAKFGDHRSIPNVFEFFEDNGTAYIVMELLEGIGLNTLISQNDGKIDRDFAIHVISEVGEALKSLHAQGIIHRDVAPDNVFICSDKELKVKLLDLGAAKLSNSDDTVVDIILKPGYSPTEQYDNTGAIGTWTDVYALGATLYVLLTGVKPEESTNRKQNDTLLPPNKIDDTISENLSNTVMKAMAIDKHMRFKSVDEFLKAINGEKKVLTLAKEKRKRKKHQIMGFCAAVLLLLIGGVAVYGSYYKMEAEELLEEATIDVWYSANEGTNEQRAMEYIITDFGSKFPNVTVNLTRYDENAYSEALIAANLLGELPDVFESSGASDDVLANAADLSEVLESEQAAGCKFLDKYNSYYVDRKQLPLGIEVPAAIVITAGNNKIDYISTSFADITAFSSANVAYDTASKDIIEANFTLPKYTEDDFTSETATCAVLLTSTDNIENYRDALLEYEWHCAYGNSINSAKFVYEWSIAPNGNREQAAAERLLMWMLGNNYQDKLMVSLAQNGEIPVNAEVFNNLCENSYTLSGLSTVCDNYDFK